MFLRAVAFAFTGLLANATTSALAQSERPLHTIETNRSFDALKSDAANLRASLREAAALLPAGTIELAGVPIDASVLRAIAESEDPSLVRAARERLGRPVDLRDFVYFIDDVLHARRGALGTREVVVPSGRARAAGILLHPDDVFENRPRLYAASKSLAIDRPEPPRSYVPASDGDALGPRWTARYPNPETEAEMLAALRAARPESGFSERIASLLDQLRAQGAEAALTSTVRRRERGYLMWGAFMLSRARTQKQVERASLRLERTGKEWGLDVPIAWRASSGWRATVEAAREMADTYEVVYATEEGARASNHYTGVAADLIAVRLPARLTLRSPLGAERTFDLSDPEASRDLSLSPELIDWIESSFELRKLESDYPHWDDARAFEP